MMTGANAYAAPAYGAVQQEFAQASGQVAQFGAAAYAHAQPIVGQVQAVGASVQQGVAGIGADISATMQGIPQAAAGAGAAIATAAQSVPGAVQSGLTSVQGAAAPVVQAAGVVAAEVGEDLSAAATAAAAAAAPVLSMATLEAAKLAGEVKGTVTIIAATGSAWGGSVYSFAAEGMDGAKEVGSDAAGMALAEMRKVAGEAPRYTSMALAAAQHAGSAAKAVSGEAAAAVGGVAAAGAAWMNDHKDEAAAFAAAGYSFMHAGLQAGGAMVPWTELSAAYKASSAELAAAVGALTGVALSMVDWVKFDVIRDYFQVVSLFFGQISSTAMAQAKVLWGNLSNIISFDLHFVAPTIPAGVIYAILGAFALVVLILLLAFQGTASNATADEVREGHEAVTWDKQKKQNARFVQFLKYTLILLISGYLPVSRAAISILSCDPSTAQAIKGLGAGIPCKPMNITGNDGKALQECDCAAWKAGYGYLAAAAVFILAVYTVAFPIYCYGLIVKNKPVGSRENPRQRYNADGLLIKYTNAMYFQDLKNDPKQQSSPFLVLYDGFEMQWAFYKVVVMVFKLVLVVPVIVLYRNPLLQSAVSLGICAVFFAFTSYARPFISKMSDFMDVSARVTSLLVIIFTLLSTPSVLPGFGTLAAVLINIFNALNAVVMVFGAAWGVEFVRNRLKGWFGVLEFTNTSTQRKGRPRDAILGGVTNNRVETEKVGGWDLRAEAKHRVWHAFWRSLLESGMKKEDPGVGHRLIELEKVTSDVGKRRIVDHFLALQLPGRAALRAWVTAELEGVDVFWDGQVADGQLDSSTCFGKMYTHAYPFHAVMVYDDSDDLAFLYEADLDALVARNADSEVQRRRGVRKAIRALEGSTVYCPFTRWESHSVEDGTESYTDDKGNTKHRTRYSTVQVEMRYTNGTLDVVKNTRKVMSAGFKVKVAFSDGVGVAVAPRTGHRHTIHNSCTLVNEELGLDKQFNVHGKIATILGHESNRPKVEANLPRVMTVEWEYRKKLKEERDRDENTLSSAFWLHVFDAEGLPRPALEWYLQHVERNPFVNAIPTSHKSGLDYLYARMAYVRSHPAVAFWYCFWDDLWTENWDCLPQVRKKNSAGVSVVRDVLDPASPVSLAYTPMPRPELEAKLTGLGLRAKYGWITDDLLDILYGQVARLEEEFKAQLQDIADGKTPVPTLAEAMAQVADAVAVKAVEDAREASHAKNMEKAGLSGSARGMTNYGSTMVTVQPMAGSSGSAGVSAV